MKNGTNGRILIDSMACKGCKYCVSACPAGAIEIDVKFNSMGYFPARLAYPEKCTGCAICAQMCPEIAIDSWRHSDR